MQRRHFLSTLAAAGALRAAAPPKGAIIELRRYLMRNSADGGMQRTSEFIQKFALPAARRNGAEVAGVFANLIGSTGPFLLMVNTFPSLAAMEEAQARLAADKEFQQALDAFNARPGLAYQRVEVTLLRAFDSMPRIEPPPVEEGRAPRVFELRVYESNNSSTLRRKIEMFEKGGEIAIFHRVGIRPVFFGYALAGTHMPNLTYLVAYDDLAARDKVWRAFGADPEWQKLRTQPGYSDAEIVSNITNELLRPLAFSPIR